MNDQLKTASLAFTRSLPVRAQVDVFVAGGGPAGVAAALAAARQGATVFLAQDQICFGGMGTSGALPMLCCFSDEINFLAGGVGRDIHDRIVAAGGALPHPAKKASDLYTQPDPIVNAGIDFVGRLEGKFLRGTWTLPGHATGPWGGVRQPAGGT